MSTLIKPRDSEADTLGTDLPSRPPWPRVLVKVVVVAWFFGLWLWAYDAVNTFSADPVRTIHLTSPATVFPWIIQPWTAVIYILGGVVFPLAPFLYYPTWRGILFVMACFTASSLVAFAIYGAWPVSMVRPEFTGGTLGERLMLWVFLVDKPANCFPSLHVIFAVLGALFDRPRRGRAHVAVVLVGIRRGRQRDDSDLRPALFHRCAGRRRGRLGRLVRRSLVGAA